MNKIKQLWRIATHPRELRLAMSGLGVRLGGDDAMGGLTEEESSALVRWTREFGAVSFVEIGTLFGLTAAAVARGTDAAVTAVDNFCWNPFGLTSEQHEAFARRILSGSGVKLVRTDAVEFLEKLSVHVEPARTMVFLDGSHAYDDVRREIELCKAQGVRIIAGHDFDNSRFGVTRAVRETLGEPDEVVGMCWIKRLPDA